MCVFYTKDPIKKKNMCTGTKHYKKYCHKNILSKFLENVSVFTQITRGGYG